MAYTYEYLRQNPKIYQSNHGALELICEECGTVFIRSKRDCSKAARKPGSRTYCSPECRKRTVIVVCTVCGRSFSRRRSQLRSEHLFCGHVCAASWTNLHKTTGTRRSKLEVWLEKRLRELYPDLEILFNAKEAINAELDIYFPSLNLAFELNGIYHYEPIHGQEKFASIQTNDHRKFQACLEHGIELCVIDVSSMNYFKPAKGQHFLDIVISIVETKR